MPWARSTFKVMPELSDQLPQKGNRFYTVPVLIVLFLWWIFWYDQRAMMGWTRFGLEPGEWAGLQGILFASFLHGSMEHLAHNSLPVLFLSMALFYYYPKQAGYIALTAATIPWIGVWFFGRPSVHIGASAFIYFMATFLFFSGLWKKNRYLLATALLVVFLYGGLFWGLFPIEERVSYEGHLSGAVTGLLFSLVWRKKGPGPTKWVWEEEVPDIEVVDAEDISAAARFRTVKYIYRTEQDP